MDSSTLTIKLLSRVLHFLSAGYIICYVGVYLWALAGAERAEALILKQAFNLALASGVVVTLTGFLGVGLILYEKTHPVLAVKNEFLRNWALILLAKVLFCLPLTSLTDWAVLKGLGKEPSTRQEVHRFYVWVASIKLIALMVVDTRVTCALIDGLLSTYAKLYRENLTENFTKAPMAEHYQRLPGEEPSHQEAYKPLVEQ